jgi:hypothetical protein
LFASRSEAKFYIGFIVEEGELSGEMSIAGDRWVGKLVAAARRERTAEWPLDDTRRELWVLVLLFFCVGDLATTRVGLSVQGVVEAGPLVATVVRAYGLAGMIAVKAATVGLFYGADRLLPDPHALGIPIGLTLVGVLVTGWNLVVLGLGVL